MPTSSRRNDVRTGAMQKVSIFYVEFPPGIRLSHYYPWHTTNTLIPRITHHWISKQSIASIPAVLFWKKLKAKLFCLENKFINNILVVQVPLLHHTVYYIKF